MATLTKKQLLTLCCLSVTGSTAFAVPGDAVQGYVGGRFNQLNRDVGDVPGNRYYLDSRFTYQQLLRNNEVDVKFDLSALVNDEGLLMYSLQETYISKTSILRSTSETGGYDKLKVGRQILDWSPIDNHWGLGKLNNRKNFDFFTPDQEGLIGLNYENKANSGLFIKIFASALYVPETNPSLDINKGKKTVTSRNPWGNPPATSTSVSGNDTPIKYDVDYPDISEVIYRNSFGFAFGADTEHFKSNFYFMRKPENQISTQVDVKLADSSEFVTAFVKPEFYYHDITGGDIQYRNLDVEAHVGGIAIFPQTFPDGNRPATEQTELKTEKRREAYGGFGISKSNDVYAMGFDYIARLSPFDREADSLATDPRWNQAVNLFFRRTLKEKFNLMGDLKYDMLTTDRLVMLRGGYNVSKELLMTLGVNMIGTPNSGKSYWSPYTNNDALYAGLRYVY